MDMAEENKEKLTGQSENDYGFPFAKVTPLKAKSESRIDTDEIEPIVPKEAAGEKVETVEIKKQIKAQTSARKNKSSHLPLQFSLVMLILIILSAMAYFLYFLPEEERQFGFLEALKKSGEIEVKLEDATAESDVEELSAFEAIEETPLEDQEYIIEEEEAQVVVQDTVPVMSAAGNIFEVKERSSSVNYYIIVSSTPSMQFAMSQAKDFQLKNKNVWIIFPYGENRNYRLSIGKFDALADATDALENLKAEYGASIWILKY